MADTAQQIDEATYQDLLNLPDNLIGEIIDGVLHTQPRPAPLHARAASALSGKYLPPYDFGDNGPGGWVILFEPELHLGSKPQILVPDLAGWRRERMPKLPEDAWFELPPDWACEVISPSTAGNDRVKKMRIYAEFGIGYYWLVDPQQKILEAYKLLDGHWLQIGSWADNEVVCIEPFDAVKLDLASLWGI